MGIKNKVVGTIAALGLSFSMLAGVAAQSATDSASGSVLLSPGDCSVTIAQSSVSFGTWKYNGTGYVHTAGNNTAHFDISILADTPGGSCEVSVSTSGLSNGSATIGAEHFEVTGGGFGPINVGDIPGNAFPLPIGAGDVDVDLELISVPNTYAPDTYSGNVTLTMGNGS